MKGILASDPGPAAAIEWRYRLVSAYNSISRCLIFTFKIKFAYDSVVIRNKHPSNKYFGQVIK